MVSVHSSLFHAHSGNINQNFVRHIYRSDKGWNVFSWRNGVHGRYSIAGCFWIYCCRPASYHKTS